jgi:hypothetical protein
MNDKPKTIDERIDALTTTMELFQHSLEDMKTAQQNTDKQINRMAVGLNRLRRYALQIALDHEVRINVLEKLEQDSDDEKDSEN